MAIRVDRPRFRAVFQRLAWPAEPAEELLDAVEDEIERGSSGLATKDDLAMMVASIKQDAAEREARNSRNQLVMVGVILGSIALATGIIIGVLA